MTQTTEWALVCERNNSKFMKIEGAYLSTGCILNLVSHPTQLQSSSEGREYFLTKLARLPSKTDESIDLNLRGACLRMET